MVSLLIHGRQDKILMPVKMGTDMIYLIKETLVQSNVLPNDKKTQYAAVITPEEWAEKSGGYDMGIELDIDITDIHGTRAEVNFDSLTGTFSIPRRDDISGKNIKFAFALDEKGIVFIDSSGEAERIIEVLKNTKRWKKPSLERFIYDFMEYIIHADQQLLEKYEEELDAIEDSIMSSESDEYPIRINDIRSDVRDLRVHYEQLTDLAQELEENENNFFKANNLRYFHLVIQRISSLHDMAASLRDYSIQVRDLYQSRLDVKQNRIMTVLTIVTTLFMPLTLIAGWYGMNFDYMPELHTKFGYPAIIILSILTVVVSVAFFKFKKWL